MTADLEGKLSIHEKLRDDGFRLHSLIPKKDWVDEEIGFKIAADEEIFIAVKAFPAEKILEERGWKVKGGENKVAIYVMDNTEHPTYKPAKTKITELYRPDTMQEVGVSMNLVRF